MFKRLSIGQGTFLLSLCVLNTPVSGTEWNGQSFSSGDWSDAGNWAFCSGLLGCEGPESDDTADFGPLGIRTTTNVDYARSIKGIKYELGARLYSISGSRLTIGSEGIKNYSLEAQVINTPITLSADQFWGQTFINNLSTGTNPAMEIGGPIDLNGYALGIGTVEQPLAFPIPVPQTWVKIAGDITGSGDIFSYGAILEGNNRFSGRIIFDPYSDLVLRGASARINAPANGTAPDVLFRGNEPIQSQRYGTFRVEDGANARVDRVIAEHDFHGKISIGEDAEVQVGADNSSFTLNALIEGDGLHKNPRLIKEGTGTVTIDTYSYDGDAFVDAGGFLTEIYAGALKMTGAHTEANDFEVKQDGQLQLDVASGQQRTITHRITGPGSVAKTGGGIALLDSSLAFTGDFHMNEGLVFLQRDGVFSGSNVLLLNTGIFNLNGHKAAFGRILNGAGRLDFENGELTVGLHNASFGNTILDETDHEGTGTLIKTGLDAMDFQYKWGQFNGTVKVEQGTLNLIIAPGRRGRAESVFDLEMTGGRLEQGVPFHVFRTAHTLVGSELDLNHTETTIGRAGVDAGTASHIGGSLLGSNELIKTGLEDLILDHLSAFTGELTVEQGTVVIGDTDTGASRIDISSGAELEIGQRVNAIIGSTVVGSGTITKNHLSTVTINNATGFNGSIVINQGKLATGTATSFGDNVDVHVVDGSFGGDIFIAPIVNQLEINAAQGFGAITGDGIIDFNSAISVGNGDKSSIFRGTLRSSGFSTLSKKGAGLVVLEADQDYRGTTFIENGELQINGRLHSDTGSSSGINTVQVANATGDARLSGSGQVGRVSGNGIVAPGQSPGILTTHSVVVSTGIDFEFEFTDLAPNYSDSDNSLNDVLRMTDSASLTGALSSENIISLYLDIGASIDGVSFEGGFFSRRFLSPLYLGNASFEVFVKDDLGSESYGGKNYSSLDLNLWDLVVEQVFLSRRFEGEIANTSGYISRFTLNDMTPAPVPLPAGAWLMLSGIASVAVLRRRRFDARSADCG